jgi:hypothetical protein
MASIENGGMMYSLNDIMTKHGESFKARNLLDGDIYEAHFIFGNIFGIKSSSGYNMFSSGTREEWEFYSKIGEVGVNISPEEQRRVREQERKEKNEEITRRLKKTKELRKKFDDAPIGRRTTKSKELFSPKLTLIKGGIDD